MYEYQIYYKVKSRKYTRSKMDSGLVVSSSVRQQVLLGMKSSDDFVGYLVGQQRGQKLYVVSCTNCQSTYNLVKLLPQSSANYPAGLYICGAYYVLRSKNLAEVYKPEAIESEHNRLAIVCQVWKDLDGDLVFKFRWCDTVSGETRPVRATWVYDDLLLDNITFRLTAQLPIAFEYKNTIRELKETIAIEFEALQEKIKSGCTVFHIDDSDVHLYLKPPEENRIVAITSDSPAIDLFDHVTFDDENIPKKKKIDLQKNVLHVNMFFLASGREAIANTVHCSPVIHHEHKIFNEVSLNLPIDILGCVPGKTQVGSLPELFANSICDQLCVMEKCLTKYRQGDNFTVPEAYHFKPEQLNHFITVVYPTSMSTESLEPCRQELHERFLLPVNYPILRRANAYAFPGEEPEGSCLLNVHVGLKPSGVKDGEEYLVKGTYAYHHYMQDRFDDNKWGCAYRSLQTLVSWLRFQGYTEKPVPNHSEIQQALVEIGDKEPSFVGSRKWIGSTEVNYVLDHLLGVASKIMFVSSGGELGYKGRELAMHFQTQGTPIMIGGGVLAHTILGVAFSEVTGELKFLILDPHYTGGEDLKVIQDKGWCGWKGADFWDKNAYYNLCMPQRPKVI